jgi:hypothetical protein
MQTALQLLTQALTDIGVVAPGETLDSNDSATALIKLQYLVNAWNGEGMTIEGYGLRNLTLTPGTARYSLLGLVLYQPVTIVSAFVRDSGSTDHPVTKIDAVQYASISDKTTAGRPYFYYYSEMTATDSDAGYMYLYPTPDAAETFYFLGLIPILAITATSDNVLIPPYAHQAFVMELALNLAPAFGYQVPSDYQMKTLIAKQKVLSRNAANKARAANLCIPGCTYSRYSILEG